MIRVLFETCLGMCMMKHGPKLPNLLLKFLGLNFVSPKLRKSIRIDNTSKCAKKLDNGSFFQHISWIFVLDIPTDKK